MLTGFRRILTTKLIVLAALAVAGLVVAVALRRAQEPEELPPGVPPKSR